MRPDDEARSDDRRGLAVRALHDALALGLERAVEVERLRRVGGQLEGRRILVGRTREVGVGGDARDEDVERDRIAQQRDRLLDDARVVAAGVDDGVPLPATEHVEPAVAVAVEHLGVREEAGVRLAARERRHLVAALERGLGRGASREPRSADDQKSDSASSRRSTSSSVL